MMREKDVRRTSSEKAKLRLQLTPVCDPKDLLCARMHGKPIYPNELTRDFAQLIREGDLPRIGFHDLRHSHATQLLRQEIHPQGRQRVPRPQKHRRYVGRVLARVDEAAHKIDFALQAAIRAALPT